MSASGQVQSSTGLHTVTSLSVGLPTLNSAPRSSSVQPISLQAQPEAPVSSPLTHPITVPSHITPPPSPFHNNSPAIVQPTLTNPPFSQPILTDPLFP